MSAVASEWIKLWTLRTVWWSLAAATLLMLAGSAQYALYAANGDLDPDLLRNGLVPAGATAVLAVGVAQFAFVAFAMLTTTSEFSTGTIRSTLTWTPSRGRLLLAKCTVVAAVVFVTGTLAALASAVAASPLLGDGADISPLTLIGDALSVGGYLTLLSVLATGLGAALRGPVVTLVTLILLLLIVPALLRTPDIHFLNRLADALPGEAGTYFLRGDTSAYPTPIALLILTTWTLAAALTGWRSLTNRDA